MDDLREDLLDALRRWRNRGQRRHALLSKCRIVQDGADVTQQVLLQLEYELDDVCQQLDAVESDKWADKPRPIRHEITIEARVSGGDEDCNLSVHLNDMLVHDYGTFGSRMMAEYCGRQAVGEAVALLELQPACLVNRLRR